MRKLLSFFLTRNINISMIPKDVLYTIFSYLSIYDLEQVSQTCKNFNQVATSNRLWSRFFTPQAKDLFPTATDQMYRKAYTGIKFIFSLSGNYLPLCEHRSLKIESIIRQINTFISDASLQEGVMILCNGLDENNRAIAENFSKYCLHPTNNPWQKVLKFSLRLSMMQNPKDILGDKTLFICASSSLQVNLTLELIQGSRRSNLPFVFVIAFNAIDVREIKYPIVDLIQLLSLKEYLFSNFYDFRNYYGTYSKVWHQIYTSLALLVNAKHNLMDYSAKPLFLEKLASQDPNHNNSDTCTIS